MSEKGIYKKTVGTGWDNPKEVRRPRENRFFEKEQSNTVGSRNKSRAKGKPRADHKHNYQPVVIWRKGWLNDAVYAHIGYRCSICGKSEDSFSFFGEKNEKYFGELEHFWQNKQDELTPIDSETYKKTIFLGGSKTINVLTDDAKSKLLDLMNFGNDFLIGDCMCADLQMQKLLAENDYKKVTVYYSGGRPRVKAGNWKTKHISSNKYLSDYERQKLKDEQMAKKCNEGFMLLNGETKGTTANIETLISLNKQCEVCLFENKRSCSSSYNIKNEKDMELIKRFYDRRT